MAINESNGAQIVKCEFSVSFSYQYERSTSEWKCWKIMISKSYLISCPEFEFTQVQSIHNFKVEPKNRITLSPKSRFSSMVFPIVLFTFCSRLYQLHTKVSIVVERGRNWFENVIRIPTRKYEALSSFTSFFSFRPSIKLQFCRQQWRKKATKAR